MIAQWEEVEEIAGCEDSGCGGTSLGLCDQCMLVLMWLWGIDAEGKA